MSCGISHRIASYHTSYRV